MNKKNPLIPCTSCARHVRIDEPVCPFCNAEVHADLRARPVPTISTARLSRAALFALGTSTAAMGANAIVACDDSPTIYPLYGGPPADVIVDAAYGGPPVDAAKDNDTPLVDAAYGGPPIDAGDGGDGGDGG